MTFDMSLCKFGDKLVDRRGTVYVFIGKDVEFTQEEHPYSIVSSDGFIVYRDSFGGLFGDRVGLCRVASLAARHGHDHPTDIVGFHQPEYPEIIARYQEAYNHYRLAYEKALVMLEEVKSAWESTPTCLKAEIEITNTVLYGVMESL